MQFLNSRLGMLYGFSALFTVLNLFLIVKGFYFLTAIPLALGIMLLFFFSLDKLLLLLILLTPFSIKVGHDQLGFTIDLPTEPLIVAIMLLFFFRLVYERTYDLRVLKHPISILIVLHLLWMFVTSVSSELPVVSFKYFVSTLWFVVTFYFVGIFLYRNPANFKLFFWLFGSALALVVIYVTWRHAMVGFERKLGYWVVQPFFNDHTHYGAILGLVAPFFLVMAFNKADSALRKRMSVLLFVLFAAGILFSYSRASWLSLGVAFGGLVILGLKIRFRLILAMIVLLIGSLYLFQTEIIMQLERNTQESSGDFSEHLHSISNITSDASNLERINRWRSALRMFDERPLLGWGPGTYQFVYAPFQRSEDYTIITTHFGDLGNAHSEYLGPLAESGLPGMLLFTALALTVLATGVRLYKKAPVREMRLIALGITLGIIAYLSHGLLNNFLDTDKASVLFWSMLAMLAAMDVFHGSGLPATESGSPSKAGAASAATGLKRTETASGRASG
jgi:putative inorganic carbon (hco3(-)) transporter